MTVFDRPHKRRKKNRKKFELSEKTDVIHRAILQGESISARIIPLVTNDKGDQVIAEWYYWTESYLNRKSKAELQKCCTDCGFNVTGTEKGFDKNVNATKRRADEGICNW